MVKVYVPVPFAVKVAEPRPLVVAVWMSVPFDICTILPDCNPAPDASVTVTVTVGLRCSVNVAVSEDPAAMVLDTVLMEKYPDGTSQLTV